MPPAKEIESKFELDEEAFERLLSLAEICDRREQWNVYYDCADRLARRSATLRLRYVRDRMPVLTFKVTNHTAGDTRISTEYEYPFFTPVPSPDLFDAQEASDSESDFSSEGGGCFWRVIDVETELPADLRIVLSSFGVRRLDRMGSIRNERFLVSVSDLGQVELDRFRLPNGNIVHEAEIENEDDAIRTKLASWLREVAPNARPASQSKFQRFRDALLRKMETEISQLTAQMLFGEHTSVIGASNSADSGSPHAK